jgi:hypothetical protein
MNKRKAATFDLQQIHKKARINSLQQVVETNHKILDVVKDMSKKADHKECDLYEKINRLEKDLEIIKKSLTNLGKHMGIDILCVWEEPEINSEYNYFA